MHQLQQTMTTTSTTKKTTATKSLFTFMLPCKQQSNESGGGTHVLKLLKLLLLNHDKSGSPACDMHYSIKSTGMQTAAKTMTTKELARMKKYDWMTDVSLLS